MWTLAGRHLRVLREVVRTLFDEGTGIPEDRLDWAVAELRAMLDRVGFLTLLAFRFALGLIQLGPPLFIGRLRRFTGLALPERRRFLERLERSPLAVLMVPVRVFACMVYLEHPDALRLPLAPLPLAPRMAGLEPVEVHP